MSSLFQPAINLGCRFFFKWGFLAYIAILPIAGTIAFRNILLISLLLLFIYFIVESKSDLRGSIATIAPWAYWFFSLYVLLFTSLISSDSSAAFSSLRSQWGPALLSWIIGAGAVFILRKNDLTSKELTIAAGFLVGVHLLETMAAWSGLLGLHVQSYMTLSSMWEGFLSILRDGYQWPPESGIPWMFRGFDLMHGNVGNTGLQTLLIITAFYSSQKSTRKVILYAISVSLIFLSFIISGSRGSVVFGLAMLLVALLITANGRLINVYLMIRKKLVHIGLVGLVLIGSILISASYNSRWNVTLIAKKSQLAASIDDPLYFICEGKVRIDNQSQQDRTSSHEVITHESIEGDGARLLLMRAGLSLVMQNPWGLDGSRQSYEKLITSYCGHSPALSYAHAHQGWMNVALALGWIGAALYALLFLEVIYKSLYNLKHDSAVNNPWTLSLLLLSIFWIIIISF